jgi:hypothetical protein
MHNVKLRKAFWGSTGGMDMVTAEIASKIESFLEREIGEVLVSECYDFALCY